MSEGITEFQKKIVTAQNPKELLEVIVDRYEAIGGALESIQAHYSPNPPDPLAKLIEQVAEEKAQLQALVNNPIQPEENPVQHPDPAADHGAEGTGPGPAQG